MIEAVLAHVVRNQTEAAYARSDLLERRRRLDDWMDSLNLPIAGPASVVPLVTRRCRRSLLSSEPFACSRDPGEHP